MLAMLCHDLRSGQHLKNYLFISFVIFQCLR
jgi:hypothetical protein